MWNSGWRDALWSSLEDPWDLIIVGGGITGAGILREATRVGMRALLVEAKDFASGASSRSSKLVHGGFRYLQNAQIKLTWESVRERERLLKEGRGLINPLGFLMAGFRDDPLPLWVMGIGLVIYDSLALKWGHRFYDAYDLRELCPPLREEGLLGGYRYFDAQTDDSRLVLRVLQEAVRGGAAALNYAPVAALVRKQSGQVCGVRLIDCSPEGEGREAEVIAPLVINATGAWADRLRSEVGGRERMRQLRGSHLIFPAQRLPLTRAVSLWHPRDGRPVFAIPWEGVTLVGTTDADHTHGMDREPSISQAEVEYLLEVVQWAFPEQELETTDILSTFSGVRPVIDTGKPNPSQESREHVLWNEAGLLTVTGGKLTTFRLMAIDALRATQAGLSKRLPRLHIPDPSQSVLDPSLEEISFPSELKPKDRLRLMGRYGAEVVQLIATASESDWLKIPGSPYTMAELRWAARAEGVLHLDDLLLRRTRLGLLLPEGGRLLLSSLRPIIQAETGWDDRRWDAEKRRYAQIWHSFYSLTG